MTDDLRARVLAAIDEQLKLCDAATPGPWEIHDAGHPEPTACAIHADSTCEIVAELPPVHAREYATTLANGAMVAASRLGWPAALRFARAEVERHGIDTDYSDCYCCETRYPCPSILAAAQAFGVEL